jgi:hypothetical protein
MIYKICVNQLLMLSVRLVLNSGILVFKFWEDQKLCAKFWQSGVQCPNIQVVHLYFQTNFSLFKNCYKQRDGIQLCWLHYCLLPLTPNNFTMCFFTCEQNILPFLLAAQYFTVWTYYNLFKWSLIVRYLSCLLLFLITISNIMMSIFYS